MDRNINLPEEELKYIKECCEVLYLPQPTRMDIIGVMNDSDISWNENLIILMSEDGKIYVYDDEALYKVADTMEEFSEIGLINLGNEVYHCREDIKPLPEEDRDKDEYIMKIREKARQLIDNSQKDFEAILDSLENKHVSI
ncbi:hypothetical protein FPV250 [Fowlpox virus]|uniref:Uncharacterized protein FPV250 n=2 Tax=Fowlpox virus TaxID=10261 RepID=V250_FOWPN|nr:hypothetical protein FPV250 [Fowlpox virus]P14362.1 RecName: Full=Uncharacterized protein FPV250; AltName: Full=BamHI-ORF4 [Fowlpox virus strain NVSL]UNS14505.1 ALPV-341 [Albatrosspox virus]WPD90997.1 hypothetical protein PPV_Vac110-fpv250 [Avipoxvirus sp.]CAE52778.1 hypothetical protein [Fowlpox virus isolate HP-438/Munich]AAF44594.1 ORF FPV250 [Fowlpox virus]AXY04691.1 hypothetical protein [Fowlpox virus]